LRNSVTARALGWASTLRYPTLSKLAAALFLLDLALPDPIRFLEELRVDLTALQLANWKPHNAAPLAPVWRA